MPSWSRPSAGQVNLHVETLAKGMLNLKEEGTKASRVGDVEHHKLTKHLLPKLPSCGQSFCSTWSRHLATVSLLSFQFCGGVWVLVGKCHEHFWKKNVF